MKSIMKNNKVYLLLALCLVIFTSSIINKNFPNDTFFTIPTGNYIIENGIDETEPFTWHNNLKFTKLRWAFDITVAQIYNFFSFDGLYVFTIIMSCIIAVTLFTTLYKSGNNKILSFIISLYTIAFTKNYLVCRAQIISYLLFILEMFFMQRLIKKNQKRDCVYLVIISILILIFHSSVWLVYFVLFLPYFAEKIFSKLNIKMKLSNKIIIEQKTLKWLIITFCFSLAIGVLTPLGTSPFTYIPKVINGISKEIIIELQSIRIIKNFSLLIICILIGLVLIFTKTKIKLTDLLYSIGLIIMSKMALRNMYIALFILTFPITNILSEFIKTYKKELIFEKIESYIDNNLKPKVICITMFIIMGMVNYLAIINQNYIDKEKYPVEAVNYIKKNVEDIDNMKIYNHFDFGSYLEFQGIKPFVDSRSEVFCREFNEVDILEDWAKVEIRKTKTISYLIEKYGITHVLIYNDREYKKDLDEKFLKLYSDHNFSFYEVK